MEPVQHRLEAGQSTQQDLRANARHEPSGLALVPAVEFQRDRLARRPRVPSRTRLVPLVVLEGEDDRSPPSKPRHGSSAKPANIHARFVRTALIAHRPVDQSNVVADPDKQAVGFDPAP